MGFMENYIRAFFTIVRFLLPIFSVILVFCSGAGLLSKKKRGYKVFLLTDDMKETEIKDGIGMVAKRANVGILPVAIKTKKGKLKFFRKTEFIVGEYISPEDFTFDGSNKEQYEKISDYAFNETCKLLESDTTPLLK